MSSRAQGKRLSKLESILKNTKCFLCLDKFKDPRELDCCHIFCKRCLDSYIKTICPNGNIDCPLCDTQTATPQHGAEGIKRNFYLNLGTTVVGVSCDVCKDDEGAIGRCIECEQDFCERCFGYHNSIASTREHHIATLGEDHLQGKLTRDLYCPIHVNEKEIYYCTECEKLVCQFCNMTKHKLHVARVTTEMSDKYREQLEKTVDSEEYVNYLQWMTERKTEVTQRVKKMATAEERAIRGINDSAKEWHTLIEDTRKMLVAHAREEAKKLLSPVKNNIKQLDYNIQSFSNVCLVANAAVKQADDVEVVVSGPKLLRKLSSIKREGAVGVIPVQYGIQWCPNPMTVEELLPLFGRIVPIGNASKSRLVSEFCTQSAGAPIPAMSPADDGRSWIIEGNEGLIQLYDNTGRVHQTFNVNLPADDMIRGPNNTKYVSCNSAKRVMVVDKEFQTSVMTKTDTCARGLAYDVKSGSLIICLTKKNAFFDYENHDNNKVVRIIVQGEKRLETPDILSYSGYPVVEYPARLSVTKSGYIAVSDWKRNCVTILDRTGHVETEYFSLRKGDDLDSFCPRGICCDDKGRILVADFTNHRIMHLDETGQMFQPVLTARNGIHHPWSVTCGVDELVWVGNKHGEVKIYNVNFPAK